MQEENNNLGNFLKKRFADFDGADNAWDRPDTEVREGILNQLAVPGKPRDHRKFFWIALASLTFLAGLTYVFYLQKEVNELRVKVNEQVEVIAEEQQQRKTTLQEYTQEKSLILQEKEQLAIVNKTILEEKISLETVIKKQQRTIFQIRKENLEIQRENGSLQNTIAEQATRNFSRDRDFINQQLKDEFLKEGWEKAPQLLRLSPLLPALSINAISDPSISLGQSLSFLPIIPVKGKGENGTIELGYSFSRLALNMPAEIEFKNQRWEPSKMANEKVNLNFNGLEFAFSPLRNWWIQTGIRFASQKSKQKYSADFIYDDREAYLDPIDRKIHHKIPVLHRTPYFEALGFLEIVMEEGRELVKTGEKVTVSFDNFQTIQFYQIPLGLAYTFDLKRLEAILQGGAQWNKMTSKDYSFSAVLKSNGFEVPTINNDFESELETFQPFFSTYAGVGLNYRIFGDCYLNANFSYNYNFIKNNKTQFLPSNKRGAQLGLGLKYRL